MENRKMKLISVTSYLA